MIASFVSVGLLHQRSLLLLACLCVAVSSNPGSTSGDKKWTNNASGNFFSTAQEACEDVIKANFPGKNYTATVKDTVPPKSDTKGCYYTDEYNREYYETYVWEVDVTPGNDNLDCSQKPNGPYRDLDGKDNTQIAPGKDFTPSQKRKIQNEWAATNNNGGVLTSNDPNDPCNAYTRLVNGKMVTGLILPPTGPFEPGKFPQKDICEAQVDHIIPEKAPDGSACGSNAYANARVISMCVNNKKKNNPNFDSAGMTMADCGVPSTTSKPTPTPPLSGQKQNQPPLGGQKKKP